MCSDWSIAWWPFWCSTQWFHTFFYSSYSFFPLRYAMRKTVFKIGNIHCVCACVCVCVRVVRKVRIKEHGEWKPFSIQRTVSVKADSSLLGNPLLRVVPAESVYSWQGSVLEQALIDRSAVESDFLFWNARLGKWIERRRTARAVGWQGRRDTRPRRRQRSPRCSKQVSRGCRDRLRAFTKFLSFPVFFLLLPVFIFSFFPGDVPVKNQHFFQDCVYLFEVLRVAGMSYQFSYFKHIAVINLLYNYSTRNAKRNVSVLPKIPCGDTCKAACLGMCWARCRTKSVHRVTRRLSAASFVSEIKIGAIVGTRNMKLLEKNTDISYVKLDIA